MPSAISAPNSNTAGMSRPIQLRDLAGGFASDLGD